MKILFTGVYSHLYGGLERFAQRAQKALQELGHTVDTVGTPPETLEDYDFVLMQKIPPTVEHVRRLKAKYGEKLHFYAHDHEMYCLRRHYYTPFRNNCDRLYSFFPCRLCAAVTRPSWIPRALTRDMIGFRNEMKDVKAFTPSNYIRDNLIKNGFPPERVKVLYPLFVKPSLAHDDWMPEKKLRMLFMGQLIAGKGVAVLLDAANLLKIPFELTIVGTGRDEKKLRAKAPQSVRFEGWQENAQRYFNTADVCIVPSLWHEPFGTVGAEALSHGVPVITFDVGGLSDWLKPGKTGFFPASKSPQDLAAAIEKIADASLLKDMSGHALDITRELFDPDRFIQELLNF